MHNQRVTINELVRLIPTIGEKLTPIIQSEPGCGKTSLLSMLEDNMGDKYDYIYVDCPVKDMQDIAMTIPNHETRTLETYVGSLFKLDSPKPKVILLDEFMKAPKLLQVIFTRLMLERFVGDTPLPDGSIVFGTSNNQSDGVGDTMLAHASNRVCLLQMQKPQVEDWLVWASENAISPLIRAWVHMFPRALNSYLDDEQKDNPYIFQPSKPQLSFVTPRSLAKASVIVENRDILGETPTMSALSGTIGYSASAFLSLEKSLPDINEILERPDTIKVPDEISAQLMVMFQALDHLKTQDQLTNFMTFIKRIKSSEIQAIFFTMLVRNKQTRILGRGNAEIAKWATENYELF